MRYVVHLQGYDGGYDFRFVGTLRLNGAWHTLDIVVARRIFQRADWESLLRQIVRANLYG
ncbi:hypothetical protein HOS13_gp02 [Caulobacter phage Lullwater]|uniref:Uncharacterized protein n=1 Tax=Caulobacter phage Lullwater TaxID=2024607 RepID=A0A291LC00_9CAUD|nr:hypothetical protein HOS13_gp02 [Caulobacter phage Lullwater]ATI16309.1 hypothetical protein Lull_002 [Caulobacter phage Lullwater]